MLIRVFRIFRAIDRNWALAVFWIYVVMFFVAFSMMFVFPPGALVMVFLGLAGLVVAIIVGRLLRGIHLGLGRLLLVRHQRSFAASPPPRR